MKETHVTVRLALSLSIVGLLLAVPSARAATTACSITFSLAGWSIFYKTASGTGTVRCDNGQSARVTIRSAGGGFTFGRSRIDDGRGRFSPVADIDEVFGSYAMAEAHAGMGPSASARALTKGTVSLELSGTGQGVDVGFAFGDFRISRAE
jgi:hypothetical protein